MLAPFCQSLNAPTATLILLLSAQIRSLLADDSAASTTTFPSPPMTASQDQAKGASESDRTTDLRARQALELVGQWAATFGRDIYYNSQEATCFRSVRDKFDPAKSDLVWKPSIKSIDWQKLHAEIVTTVSNTMGWHRDAVEAIAHASEDLAGNHTFNRTLKFEYIDVHRIRSVDELAVEDASNSAHDGINLESSYGGDPLDQLDPELNTDSDSNSTRDALQPPSEPLPKPSELVSDLQRALEHVSTEEAMSLIDGQEEWQTDERILNMSRHKNFGDVLINTEESAVHVPVHIYPGDPQVMNGIAWSDQLTSVFKNNFVRNPKLTNQYFASQYGFLRLYPAQKWQIARSDPDLYDARMRPWYVAGVSSRKDVIILVDSSGSMTGSRRDIARGVVFEILDTLTDNDHFMILKFSDTVQQVGVPSCAAMRVEKKHPSIPAKNIVHKNIPQPTNNDNETDVESLYLLPATGRNIRSVKTNFTIPTSGIANFSRALVTAFEVLRNYQDSDELGSQCNQAIMLITDGSPSDFEDIFNRYNYPNAPLRVFTYLIGREAGDVTHTKMMACHNRGFYTHVINLAEVRETVQQYIPVMARPLVLSGIHPITWTPAYGELTYQILTDWVWESKRRSKARNIIATNSRTSFGGHSRPDITVTTSDDSSRSNSIYSNDEESFELALEEEYDALDLFGYNNDIECFWETHRNDLLTTVVRPVYDRKNESIITEKFLVKSTWTIRETLMRTAQILGVAAADMKINDIIALAPSHKLGANGYSIMLTNNGYAMHHPDLRSILEPFSNDPSEKEMRILKPFFSSLDLTQVEHVMDMKSEDDILSLRKAAVGGKTGFGELKTKRTTDCQRRVQSRLQSFYYKPIKQFPFSFMIAIPQPYGSHKLDAMVEVTSPIQGQNLTQYFAINDYDLWVVHPEYRYCEGPSNNTLSTLLGLFLRIESSNTGDVWKAFESSKPPVLFPGQISCDKELVKSLIYDAIATLDFSRKCGFPELDADPLAILLALLPRSSLIGMIGLRFSFIATRSGLTRVRSSNIDDYTIKKEALAFARRHARAIDETYYSRTVDYNMLINDTAVLIQVPFNSHEKIQERFRRYEEAQVMNTDSFNGSSGSYDDHYYPPKTNIKEMTIKEKLDVLTNSSLHTIITQAMIVKEGKQQAVAGVAGAFYDYATFVLRFFNSTNTRLESVNGDNSKHASCFTGTSTDERCESSGLIKCGHSNDTIDCLLVDNNGFIVVSEDLDFIGRHLKSYDPAIMNRLVETGVYHEVNITDHQSVCMRQDEKQTTSSALSFLFKPKKIVPSFLSVLNNLASATIYTWTSLISLCGWIGAQPTTIKQQQAILQQNQESKTSIPGKTYLRPCSKNLILYETRSGKIKPSGVQYYTSKCGCKNWFVYEQVSHTNLIMVVADTTQACRHECDSFSSQNHWMNSDYNAVDISTSNQSTEEQVCSMLEQESRLERKKLDSCFSHHPDEEHIKICGSASKSSSIHHYLMILVLFISSIFMFESTSK